MPSRNSTNSALLKIQHFGWRTWLEEVTGRRDGRYQDDTRKALIVAKHLDNPAVAKAKGCQEAFKDSQTRGRVQGVRVARTPGRQNLQQGNAHPSPRGLP